MTFCEMTADKMIVDKMSSWKRHVAEALNTTLTFKYFSPSFYSLKDLFFETSQTYSI
jgi:hypothetical protein